MKKLTLLKHFNPLEWLAGILGWLGIIVYFLYHPLQFSLLGVLLYLTIKFCVLVLFLGLDRLPYKGLNGLDADLVDRRALIRKLKRVAAKNFPGSKFLLREKYDYTKIRLNGDFESLRYLDEQDRNKSLTHFFATKPGARHRIRYRDPKINDTLRKYQLIGKEKTFREVLLALIARSIYLFVFYIPSEDGLFLVPPALIGINVITVSAFSLFFGFFHFWKYSVMNCLRIACSTIFVISVILPTYGLMTCIIGHVLYDLLVFSYSLRTASR